MRQLLLIALLLPTLAWGQSNLKADGGAVYDFANVLTEAEEQALEQDLTTFKRRTTNEFAVVTLESYEGRTPFDFNYELFERWGIGGRYEDNGFLLTFSPKERKWFGSTGYGLEADLPDAIVKRIGEGTLPQNFRNKNYYQGAQDFVDEAQRRLGYTSPPEEVAAAKKAIAEEKIRLEKERAALAAKRAEEERIRRERAAAEAALAAKKRKEYWDKNGGTFMAWGFFVLVLVLLGAFIMWRRNKRLERERIERELEKERQQTISWCETYPDLIKRRATQAYLLDRERIESLYKESWDKVIDELDELLVMVDSTTSLEKAKGAKQEMLVAATVLNQQVDKLAEQYTKFRAAEKFDYSNWVARIRTAEHRFENNNKEHEYPVNFDQEDIKEELRFANQAWNRMVANMDIEKLEALLKAQNTCEHHLKKAENIIAEAKSVQYTFEEAKRYLKEYTEKLPQLIRSAKSACNDSDVKYSTKSDLDKAVKAAEDFVPTYKQSGVVRSKQDLTLIVTALAAVKTQASRDISAAESARAAAVAAAAAAARRRNSTSSTSSTSFGGFGGGSTGGGGAGGSW